MKAQHILLTRGAKGDEVQTVNTKDLNAPLLEHGEPMPDDIWTLLGARNHPLQRLPSEQWLRLHTTGELLDFLEEREETFRLMEADPHAHGHEPFTWKILDALCGLPWLDHSEEEIADELDSARRVKMRENKTWCLKVRQALLRQQKPVKILLLNGGQRAGKSEWAASRVMRILLWKPKRRAWCFNQDADMSRDYQQPLIYKYFPASLRGQKAIRKGTTYIANKQQTGFTDGKFTLPNSSDCNFRYYSSDIGKDEGGEIDVIWGDEKMTTARIKIWMARVATRNGWIFLTFTPTGDKGTSSGGYTPTVKMFVDSAQTTRESIAFVLPKDGKEPRLDLALAGENYERWLDDDGGKMAQPPVPAGREFERVPRIMRCSDKDRAVFFFHSFDNPFGNPAELYKKYSSDGLEERRMRLYGVAARTSAQQFAFNHVAHTFPRHKLPTRGTWFQLIDPCSGRNFFMIWVLVERAPIGLRFWVTHEWPCQSGPNAYVPGVGNMGEWAISGDKLDGDRGPAQIPLHWGLLRYRAEIARIEGHKDWEKYCDADGGVGIEEPVNKGPFKWDDDDVSETVVARRRASRSNRTTDADGALVIEERYMDSRYGASPTHTREGDTTLLEEFDKIGLQCVPASGARVNERGTGWIQLINELLHYDAKHPIGPLNEPRLRVCDDCLNTIFALQNWTGEDGEHGACKDPVDLIKYMALADLEDWSGSSRANH